MSADATPASSKRNDFAGGAEFIDVFAALGMLGDGADMAIPSTSDSQQSAEDSANATSRLKLCTRSSDLIANEVADWLDKQCSHSQWAACRPFSPMIRQGLGLPYTSGPFERGEDGHLMVLCNDMTENAHSKSELRQYHKTLDVLSRLAALILLGSIVTTGEAGRVSELSMTTDSAQTGPQIISALRMHAIARYTQSTDANRRTPGPSVAPMWPGLMQRDREEVLADELTRQRRQQYSILSTGIGPGRRDSQIWPSTPRGSLASRQMTMRRDSFNFEPCHDQALFQHHTFDHAQMQDSLMLRRHRAYEVLGMERSSRPRRNRDIEHDTCETLSQTRSRTAPRPTSILSSQSSPARLHSGETECLLEDNVQDSILPSAGTASRVRGKVLPNDHYMCQLVQSQYGMPAMSFPNLSSNSDRRPVGPGWSPTSTCLTPIESSDVNVKRSRQVQGNPRRNELVDANGSVYGNARSQNNAAAGSKPRIHLVRSVREYYSRRRSSFNKARLQAFWTS